MTLKQYNAFITSVEEGSISKAAKKLNITQSAITHLINDFESELGFTIMVRNKGGIKLTSEGKRILPTLKEIVELNKKFIEISSKIKGESKNNITIATFSSVGVNWLPSIINGFKSIYNDVEISIINGGYSVIRKALEEGSCDIGFITLPTSQNLKCYPLVKDEILAILPKGHHLCSLTDIPAHHFETESVISLDENTDNDSRTVFEERNIKPNITYKTTDDYAMISMVKNNLGICLEPKLLLSGNLDGVEIKSLSPPAYRQIALAVPYQNYANPLTVKLIEYILSWVQSRYPDNLI